MTVLQLKLRETAQAMVAEGKGILAMDESNPTCNKRFAQLGIIPGIKVDAGTVDLAARPGEKITEGLDGLRIRLTEYAKLGLRFAKWRAVIAIDNHISTQAWEIWKGQESDVLAVQKALYHRAECNSAARRGLYNTEMEKISI